ncbi:hypothetical protein GF352_03020 [archaeon]|nr:hypothetical protein [archaeon]
MPDIPELKLLLVLTVVFVVGMFVFIVIFKALMMVEGLKQGAASEEDVELNQTMQFLQLMPWLLGILYLILIGVIAYLMFRKYGGGGPSSVSEKEIAEFRKKLR